MKNIINRNSAPLFQPKKGPARYRRDIHLPRLIMLPDWQLQDLNIDQMKSIISKLNRALRYERNRGKQGHWTYDLNRHLGLAQAYRYEKAVLARMTTPKEQKPKHLEIKSLWIAPSTGIEITHRG